MTLFRSPSQRGPGMAVPAEGRRRSPWRPVAAALLALTLTLAVPAVAPAAPDAGAASGPTWIARGLELVRGWLAPGAPGIAGPGGPPAPESPDSVTGTVGPVFDPDGYAPTAPPQDDENETEDGD